MRHSRRTALAVCATAAALVFAGCNMANDVGYVEIKTVPASAQRLPTLYLDAVKLDPVQKGVAVLQQRTGTARLSTDGFSGQMAVLCEVVVKKNRITTVTISVTERPPRCQCRNTNGNSDRVCVS